MQGEIHDGPGLKYLTVTPDDYNPEASYPLVIMLHGFGANMHRPCQPRPRHQPHRLHLRLPQRPHPLQPRSRTRRLRLDDAPRRLNPRGKSPTPKPCLSRFFDEALTRFNVAPGNCLLLGFSQGGGMTYRCGLGRADLFAGLAALSATLPGADELDHRLPPQRTQPIFVAHGRYDQMIAESTAHSAKTYLENAGYAPEFHIYDIGHEISGEVIRDLTAWMSKVLPPNPA